MMETLNKILNISVGKLTIGTILWAAAVFVICLLATKALLKLLNRAIDRAPVEPTLRAFVRAAAKVVLLFISVVITLGTLGIPVTSLVALFSVAGVAVSLAIQGALSNLTSGIQLLSVHPFKVGDYIDTGGVSGNVEEIGLVHTRLTTADNKVIFVPNSSVTSSIITNYSANAVRRVDLRIGVSYSSKNEEVKQALLRAAGRIRHVDLPAPPFAAIDSFAESSVQYLLRLWVRTDLYWEEYFKLNEYVWEELQRSGISIPFAQLDVHLIEPGRQDCTAQENTTTSQ